MSEEIFQSPSESQIRPSGEPSASQAESASTQADQSPGETTPFTWPIRRLAVALGIILVVVLGVIFIWQVYFPSVRKQLQDGEAYWRAGQSARQQRQWDKAIRQFSKAAGRAAEVIERLEAGQSATRGEPTAEQLAWLGQAYWLRARALFGVAASEIEQESAQRQTPPPSGLPTPDQEDVLELFLIRDPTARTEAVNSLYRASLYLRTDLRILRETLKHRMNESIELWHWRHIRQLAEGLLQMSTSEPSILARVYFALALIHYHQPDFTDPQDRGRPRSDDKKEPQSMLQALQWLEKLETVEKPLRFRALYLRARIWQWLADVRSFREPIKAEQAKVYRQQLEDLLFDRENGLVGALGQQAESGLGQLSPMDVEGLFGLYRLALNRLGKITQLAPNELAQRKQQLVESALRLVQRSATLPEARLAVAWRAIREAAHLLYEARRDSQNDWWQHAVHQLDEAAETLCQRSTQFGAPPEEYALLAEIALAQAKVVNKDKPQQLSHWAQRTKVWRERAEQELKKTRFDSKVQTQLDRIQRDLNQLRVPR